MTKSGVGVAIYFLVRRKGAAGFRVFYNAVADYAKSTGKVEYIKDKPLATLDFREIIPDTKGNWLNQSGSNFENLIPLTDLQTKLAKTVADERAVFGCTLLESAPS